MKERHTALLEYIAEHGKTDFHVNKLFAGTDGIPGISDSQAMIWPARHD